MIILSIIIVIINYCNKYYIIDVWEIQKHKINYMIVLRNQDPVNNSILGLHLGRGMVSSVRMVS